MVALTALPLLAAASVAPSLAAQVEIFSVAPAFTPFNVAGRTVTVKGIGFTAASVVNFDGVAATPTTYVDSRTLVATVPTVAAAKVSTVTVTDTAHGTDSFYPFMYTGPVLYVALTGNDGNPGTAPGAPKRTLANAMAAVSGTTPTEIRVSAGSYSESQLAILQVTALSCGWAPGFATRDPDRFVTDIDGHRAGYVIRTFGLAAVSAIDGCTIRNGLRDGFGGGAVAITADSPVLNNNVIVGNMSTTQGGGVYFTASTSYGGRTTISNNVILGNRSHGKGGGGFNAYFNYNTQQAVEVSLSGNQIVGNRSVNSRGGGVGITTGSYAGYNNASLEVADNFIGYNRAKTGGGVDVSTLTYGDTLDVAYDNNLVVGNSAQGTAGGVAFQGLGTLLGHINSNTISQNGAGPSQGGGLVISGSVNVVSTFTATEMILWGNLGGDVLGQAIDRVTYSDSGALLPGTGNISVDPAFVPGPLGSFYLRQNDPNHPDSPAVNAGSVSANERAVEGLTTRRDLTLDSGTADLGYHYAPSGSDSATPISFLRVDPISGDLSGADWVLVRGDGFDLGATVQFGGVAATSTIYLAPTRLLAQPPPHALGLVDVKVVNPDNAFAQSTNAYRYIDNEGPTWVSTVGVVSIQTGVDCVRSAVVDWNAATDTLSPPVVYEVYREDCVATTSNQVPCANFGYIPSAVSFIASTLETMWVDLNFVSGGQDPKVIYTVRARDSASPTTNKEWNFAKRVSLASKLTTDTVPPSPVGNTLTFQAGSTNVLDWEAGTGATGYAVYRTTVASQFGTPGTVPRLATLTTANNDLNGDGVTDTKYTDFTVPPLGTGLFYRISAIDTCNVETTSELLP